MTRAETIENARKWHAEAVEAIRKHNTGEKRLTPAEVENGLTASVLMIGDLLHFEK